MGSHEHVQNVDDRVFFGLGGGSEALLCASGLRDIHSASDFAPWELAEIPTFPWITVEMCNTVFCRGGVAIIRLSAEAAASCGFVLALKYGNGAFRVLACASGRVNLDSAHTELQALCFWQVSFESMTHSAGGHRVRQQICGSPRKPTVLFERTSDAAIKLEPLFDGIDREWKLHEGAFGCGLLSRGLNEPWSAARCTGVTGHHHTDHGARKHEN